MPLCKLISQKGGHGRIHSKIVLDTQTKALVYLPIPITDISELQNIFRDAIDRAKNWIVTDVQVHGFSTGVFAAFQCQNSKTDFSDFKSLLLENYDDVLNVYKDETDPSTLYRNIWLTSENFKSDVNLANKATIAFLKTGLMPLLNLDGNCFLNHLTQIILTLMMDEYTGNGDDKLKEWSTKNSMNMKEEHFKKTPEILQGSSAQIQYSFAKKVGGRPFADLNRLRATMGEFRCRAFSRETDDYLEFIKFNFRGVPVIDAQSQYFDLSTAKDQSLDLNAALSKLPVHAQFLFVLVNEPQAGFNGKTVIIPTEAFAVSSGNAKYELVATTHSSKDHIFANLKLRDQWLSLGNEAEPERIHPGALFNDQIRLLVYRRLTGDN